MMLRREPLWECLTPIPPSWVHDHWLVVLCEILNMPACISPELLTRYRLHPGQTIGVNPRTWFRKRLSDAEKNRKFLQREERYRDLLLHLENRILPVAPEAFFWVEVIHQAQRKLANRAQLPWWLREWNRVISLIGRAA